MNRKQFKRRREELKRALSESRRDSSPKSVTIATLLVSWVSDPKRPSSAARKKRRHA